MGIAIAILEELRKSGCLFLVTTHYPQVKAYAEETKRICNARMAFDRESLKPLYQLEVGEAGESCAFYIAKHLGMPGEMLRVASKAAYGTEQVGNMDLEKEGEFKKEFVSPIRKEKVRQNKQKEGEQFGIGDSVMVFPQKKLGIVCECVDQKGMLRVQMPDGKIQINHKRLKLHVEAEALYPEDYDFSIIFESVEDRKKRHNMGRKYSEGLEIVVEE
jgi:dsDNA-specific endonuclease/ATPase MutS2